MKRPRLRGRWPWLGLLLVPALAWAVVLALVPTDWARARLVDRLASATGRSVRIGALRLGVLGNLRILDLSLAERSTPDRPLAPGGRGPGRRPPRPGPPRPLRPGRDRGRGRLAPGLAAEGRHARDRRPPPRPPGPARAAGPAATAAEAPIAAEGPGREHPGRRRAERDPVRPDRGRGRGDAATAGSSTLDELKGHAQRRDLRDGRQARPRPGHAPVRGRGPGQRRRDRRAGCRRSAYFVPVVAGTTDGVGGKLDLLLALKGQGATRAEVRRSLRGHGSVLLDPIDLDGSKFLAALDVLGDWPQRGPDRLGLGRLRDRPGADLHRGPDDPGLAVPVRPGRLDRLRRPVRLLAAGSTRSPPSSPARPRAWISELKVNFDQLAGLRLRGTPDQVEVTVHGHPLTGDPGRPDDERARFRETARRIRDRFFR